MYYSQVITLKEIYVFVRKSIENRNGKYIFVAAHANTKQNVL